VASVEGIGMIDLYQFTCSHYCEKARWALDYKGIPFTPKNLLPGLHVKVAQTLAAKTCLPIIVDDGRAVQDSTEIITFLDNKYPDHALTPKNPKQAKEALEWEEYLDEEVGITLRLWFYYHVLPDRGRALRFLLEGGPWYGRPLFAFIYPKVRSAMINRMNINAQSAKDAEERLFGALRRLDHALKDRRYLVGDGFSRADLTACALLSAYCLPNDQEAIVMFPKQLRTIREQQKASHFFVWVRDMYNHHRHRSPAEAKAAA
jgi:glutathione S-transferase